jgi:small subunit ribosomal protein S8
MDPIADMLTAIRNAQSARLASVTVPASKVKTAILAILKREGFVADVIVSADIKPKATVTLKYDNRRPVINHIRRISKPGLRIYAKHNELPKPLNGMGIAIISTPNGVLTDKEARKVGTGGEVLCEIW